MLIKKPLLAAPIREDKGDDITRMRFPGWASIKTDGIRTLCMPNGATTRKLLPIPNDYIRDKLSDPRFRFMDGEVHGLKRNGTLMDFNDTQSVVMTKAGQPDFVFMVFDHFEHPELQFYTRCHTLLNLSQLKDYQTPFIEFVDQKVVESLAELKRFGAKCVTDGHEGAIYRDPQAAYKEGRSTFLQGILTKWVPYARSEGIIVGFEEMMHNANPAEQDALGHTKRSSHKANMIPTGILGAFIVLTEEWGTFNVGVGPGLDHALRQKIWENQDDYHHKLLNFRYKPYGTKYKPRHPQYMGIRYASDIGEPV